MSYAAADTYRAEISTYDAGVLTDADITPTGTLVVSGTDTATVVTVTNTSTGRYKVSAPLTGLTAGSVCYIRISATVGGVVGETILSTFRIGADVTSFAGEAVGEPVEPATAEELAAMIVTGSPIVTNAEGQVVASNAGDVDSAAIAAAVGAALSGATITVQTPYDSSDELLTIRRGDAYLDADGRAVTISVDVGTTMPDDITTATCALKYRRKGTSATPASITGTISTAVGTTKVFKFDLPAATTGALELGRVYTWELEVLLGGSATSPVTPVSGDMMVVKDLR